MNISITVPDTLSAEFRKAVNDTYPDADPSNAMTTKQVAEKITAEFWRRVYIDYVDRTSQEKAEADAKAAEAAAQAKARTDAAGIV